MLLKPLILGVSIDFGLLSIALTLRFIIYPLYQSWISQKNLVNEKTIVEVLVCVVYRLTANILIKSVTV